MLMLMLMAMFMIINYQGTKGGRDEGTKGRVTQGPGDQGDLVFTSRKSIFFSSPHSTIVSEVKQHARDFFPAILLRCEFLKAAFTLGTGKSREVRLVAETTKVLPVDTLHVSLTLFNDLLFS